MSSQFWRFIDFILEELWLERMVVCVDITYCRMKTPRKIKPYNLSTVVEHNATVALTEEEITCISEPVDKQLFSCHTSNEFSFLEQSKFPFSIT